MDASEGAIVGDILFYLFRPRLKIGVEMDNYVNPQLTGPMTRLMASQTKTLKMKMKMLNKPDESIG